MPEPVATDRRPERPREREPGPRPLLRTILGSVLRRIRREQDRTLAEVARAARVSMPYLSELERGRKEASSEVLAAVCDALEIDLAILLTEVGRGLAAGRGVPAAERLPGAPRQPGGEVGAGVERRSSSGVQAGAAHRPDASVSVHTGGGTVLWLDDVRRRRSRRRHIPTGRSARGWSEVAPLRAA